MADTPLPRRMTWRARGYLTAVAVRNIGTGLLCILFERVVPTPAIRALSIVLPLVTWGVLYLASGLVSALSAVVMSETMARLALVSASGLSGAWFGVFAVQAIHQGVAAAPLVWLLALFCAVFAGKDYIASAMPMRTPLEDLILGRRRRG